MRPHGCGWEFPPSFNAGFLGTPPIGSVPHRKKRKKEDFRRFSCGAARSYPFHGGFLWSKPKPQRKLKRPQRNSGWVTRDSDPRERPQRSIEFARASDPRATANKGPQQMTPPPCVATGHTRKPSSSLALSSVSKKVDTRRRSPSYERFLGGMQFTLQCESPNTSRRFALGASNVCLVGENPTCSVPPA